MLVRTVGTRLSHPYYPRGSIRRLLASVAAVGTGWFPTSRAIMVTLCLESLLEVVDTASASTASGMGSRPRRFPLLGARPGRAAPAPVPFHQNLLPRVIIKDVTRGVGEGEGHPEVAFGCQCGTLQVVGNQSNLLVALSLRREAARCIQCRSRLRGNFTGERCVDTPSLINTYAHRSLSSVNCFGR